MNPGTARYKPAEGAMQSRVGDLIYLLEPKKGIYYELNATGSLMWERLQQGTPSAEELANAVAAEYEVTPDQTRADVDLFLSDLIEKELVEACHAPS